VQLSQAVLQAGRRYQTPCLLIDRGFVAAKYRAVAASLPEADVYYAVKANPHALVVATLAALGCGFEVASAGELRLLVAMGVPTERMISSHPIKSVEFLSTCHAFGLDRLVVDSADELRKVADHAPGSRVSCRLAVDNTGSEWPLSRKFGVGADEAVSLLEEAARLGLEPHGVHFHVGSQCLHPPTWRAALEAAAGLWQAAAARGLSLRSLNLGGGLPVQHLKPIPRLDEIGRLIASTVRELFPPEVRLAIEPGRSLVGDAAVLVSSVVGRARRGDERWLYLDVGVFNGLMETIEGFGYELRAERDGPTDRWTVAGPSCDSVDVPFPDVELPELEVGERVYVMNAGAYTLSYASSFNGFGPPEVHALEDGPTDDARLTVRVDARGRGAAAGAAGSAAAPQ
jgi:ornithine decarboxylase